MANEIVSPSRYMRSEEPGSGITAPGSGITTRGIGISSFSWDQGKTKTGSGIKILIVFGVRDQHFG